MNENSLAVTTRIFKEKAIQKIILLLLTGALLISGLYFLNVTVSNLAYSFVFASFFGVLEYLRLLWKRRKTEPESPRKRIFTVLPAVARLLPFYVAYVYVNRVNPDFGDTIVEAVWPILGIAIYLFAFSLRNTIRTR